MSIKNQQPSKKSNQLKLFIILPAIILFLMSFNTKEVFEVKNNKSISQEIYTSENAIDLVISKNTTNKSLEKIKQQLRLDNVDFSPIFNAKVSAFFRFSSALLKFLTLI